jgi:hypothetical protein
MLSPLDEEEFFSFSLDFCQEKEICGVSSAITFSFNSVRFLEAKEKESLFQCFFEGFERVKSFCLF